MTINIGNLKGHRNFDRFALRNDKRVAIMRTAERGDRFCIYDEQFTSDPNNEVPPEFGMPQYSQEEISGMFKSGELTALK